MFISVYRSNMEVVILFKKELLEKIMKDKDFTAYKLWKTSKVAQSTISTILSGNNLNPSAKTLQKLATALDVPMSSFFDDEISVKSSDSETISVPKKYSDKYKVTSRDKKQYLLEMKKANEAFFMDDEYDEDTKKEMLDLMSELFWEAKSMNKRKK